MYIYIYMHTACNICSCFLTCVSDGPDQRGVTLNAADERRAKKNETMCVHNLHSPL